MSEWGGFDPEMLDRFTRFIVERQNVYWRRASGEPPPWTSDPALARYHFTNVYRELDPGTTFAAEWILDRPETFRGDRLFNLMIYRLIGREETMRKLGWLDPLSFDRERFYFTLDEIKRSGGTPYTGAYMVNGYHWMGTRDKAENITRLIEEMLGRRDIYNAPGERRPGWAALVKELDRADRASFHAVLSGVNGWGGFLAYQVMVDLSYAADGYLWPGRKVDWPRLGNNDGWVFLGSGARKGLDALSRERVGVRAHQTAIEALDAILQWRLAHGGFLWIQHNGARPVPLTKANVLNCLCEFYKYQRVTNGGVAPRKGFDPEAAYRRAARPEPDLFTEHGERA